MKTLFIVRKAFIPAIEGYDCLSVELDEGSFRVGQIEVLDVDPVAPVFTGSVEPRDGMSADTEHAELEDVLVIVAGEGLVVPAADPEGIIADLGAKIAVGAVAAAGGWV